MWTGSSESGDGMGDFTNPNERQRRLCLDTDVNPEGMQVIHESDDALTLLHHKSRNQVMIIKGEAQRRKEQNGNQ